MNQTKLFIASGVRLPRSIFNAQMAQKMLVETTGVVIVFTMEIYFLYGPQANMARYFFLIIPKVDRYRFCIAEFII